MAVDSALARYRDITTLGVGGMATVVLAEDTVLGRPVALKRMHPSVSDPRGLLRLRREALVGASLSHRNLVSIYDVIDSEDGDAVIVMEYVHGQTLREALSRQGQLDTREALRVLGGVAAGLDAIHARGIVHRDVKPANVLLGAEGSVKLADLGIASVPDHTRITTAGTILGSFRYMAPEQLKDGPATRAIDIYALAAMAFEVLSGRQARREPNPLAVAHAIATQPPPDLTEAWPAAPASAAELLMRGMCRDPAGRPASAGELVARLRAALEPEHTARVQPAVWRGVTATGAVARANPRGEARITQTRSGARGRASALGARPSSAPRSGPASPRAVSEERQTVPPATAWNSVAEPRKTFSPRRRPAWARVLAPLALAFVVDGVILALLSSDRPSSPGSRRPPSTGAKAIRAAGGSGRGTASTRTRGAAAAPTRAPGLRSPSATATPPSSKSPAAPATPPASSGASGSTSASGGPVAAVESFYELAAAHRYTQAWALADPTFRSQLGGYNSFQAGQAADRSITFNTARVIRQVGGTATVYVQTTSVRTSGTRRCAGTVQMVSGGQTSRWLVHLIGINCT